MPMLRCFCFFNCSVSIQDTANLTVKLWNGTRMAYNDKQNKRLPFTGPRRPEAATNGAKLMVCFMGIVCVSKQCPTSCMHDHEPISEQGEGFIGL